MSADAYLTARTAFSAVKAELTDVVQVIGTVASQLQGNPTRFIFANQPTGLPMEATMSRESKSVDAGRWPSVERIMGILERYHATQRQLEQAWAALPPATQEGLKAPTDLITRY